MKKIKVNKPTFRRRSFLSGGLAALAALPVASSILSSRAVAQQSDVPVRFLAIRSAHGTHRNLWIPRVPGGAEPGTDVSLNDLTFDTNYSLLRPIQNHPLKNKISIVDGIDYWVHNTIGNEGFPGHFGAATGLTGSLTTRAGNGRPRNQSVDNFLYNRLQPGEGPHLIGACCMKVDTRPLNGMTFRPDGSAAGLEHNPGTLFNNVLGNGGGGGGAPDFAAAQRGLYDDVIEDIQRLESQLRGSELAKAQSHLAAMERLRDELGVAPVEQCSPNGPQVVQGFNPRNPSHIEQRSRNHARVIAQAFACGRSRVASLRLSNQDTAPYWGVNSIQNSFPGGGEYHDPVVHQMWLGNPSNRIQTLYSLGMQWQTQMVLNMLTELDDVSDPMDPSGTSSVLDNTIVYWYGEFGHGGHPQQGASVPVVIAGGGGGRLKTGRYLRVRNVGGNIARPSGNVVVPHNRLLTTFCNAMGSNDVTYYGDDQLRNDQASFGRFHGDLPMVLA